MLCEIRKECKWHLCNALRGLWGTSYKNVKCFVSHKRFNGVRENVEDDWKKWSSKISQNRWKCWKSAESGAFAQVQTVNQAYYVDILSSYVTLCAEKGLDLGPKIGFCIMTMFQLTNRSVSKSLWPKKSITQMEHAPYTPDVSRNEFCS